MASPSTTKLPSLFARLSADFSRREEIRYKSVLLFGAPGAGKGTQGRVLKSLPGFYHFSCGDVFRRIDRNSELGRIFFEYSSRGELVPDEVTIRMWAENLHAHAILGNFKPNQDLLILDGIPRTVAQARMLDEYIDVQKILYMVCPDKKAMAERIRLRAIKENRFDDADEKVITHRFSVYEQETQPVLQHYPPAIIHEINSMNSPAHVARDVLQVLAPLQDQHYTGLLN